MLKGWKYLKRRQSFPFFCGSILVSNSFERLVSQELQLLKCTYELYFLFQSENLNSLRPFLYLPVYFQSPETKSLMSEKNCLMTKFQLMNVVISRKKSVLLVNLLEKTKSEQKIGKLTVCGIDDSGVKLMLNIERFYFRHVLTHRRFFGVG